MNIKCNNNKNYNSLANFLDKEEKEIEIHNIANNTTTNTSIPNSTSMIDIDINLITDNHEEVEDQKKVEEETKAEKIGEDYTKYKYLKIAGLTLIGGSLGCSISTLFGVGALALGLGSSIGSTVGAITGITF